MFLLSKNIYICIYLKHLLNKFKRIKFYIFSVTHTLICDKTEIDTYSETTNIFKRYINEDSINNFNEMLNLASWENFHKITCPNKAYDSFLELITSFYHSHKK